VTWSVLDAELVFDEFGNALGGPEIGFPAVSLCPLFEQLDELLSILVIELRIRSLISFISRAFDTVGHKPMNDIAPPGWR